MAQDGASKITTEEEKPQLPQLVGVPTANPGIPVVTERGPIGLGPVLTAWEDYVAIYGKDIANGDGSHQVRGYFAEGGGQIRVNRIVHYSDIDDASTYAAAAATLNINTGATSPTQGSVLGANVGPFDLEPGDTLIASINGGGDLTATFSATAGTRTAGNSATYALSNGDTLTISVDGGSVQTITFLTSEFVSIGAATTAEVNAVINAKLVGAHADVSSGKPRITSDKRGSASGINVTGGSANTALGFTTGNSAGTGNVADIDAVTISEVVSIAGAAFTGSTVVSASGALRVTTNTAGTGGSVQIKSSSTADDELGLDNAVHSGTTGAAQATLRGDGKYHGSYANSITYQVANASNGDASMFDLKVLQNGVVERTFTNLTMDSTSGRYAPTVANDSTSGSQLVTLTDLALSGTATQRRPANGTYGPMTGGNDGLTSLADSDFIGSSAGGTGLYAFDQYADMSILINGGRATAALQNAMLTYCEVWRKGDSFVVLDPPEGLSTNQVVTYVTTTAALHESSEFGAIYWPRVKVLNPNKALFGSDENIVVAPSGLIAGVMARGDSVEGGVYKQPAGLERGKFRSVTGFETDESKDERKRDLVYPKRINPLWADGSTKMIDGSRTLKSTDNFPSVGERRGVIFIEQTIKKGLQFARHDDNTPELRAQCDRVVTAFLTDEMRYKNAFRSKDPAKAFFVDFGDALNPDSMAFQGKMQGRIGLATKKPAEFIRLRFSQDTRALDAELQSA